LKFSDDDEMRGEESDYESDEESDDDSDDDSDDNSDDDESDEDEGDFYPEKLLRLRGGEPTEEISPPPAYLPLSPPLSSLPFPPSPPVAWSTTAAHHPQTFQSLQVFPSPPHFHSLQTCSTQPPPLPPSS
jgi:hypothetical protein